MEVACEAPPLFFLDFEQPARKRAQPLLRKLQGAARREVALAVAALAEGAPHDRRQAPEPMLKDVVRGAGTQRLDRAFLAHRAGDQDERNQRVGFAHVLQRLQAGVVGQGVIGEDEIEKPGREGRLECRPARGERGLAAKSTLGERPELQFRVGRLVLQDQRA